MILIGFRANSNGQWFRNDETIKILKTDGSKPPIFEVNIPGDTSLGGYGGAQNTTPNADKQILLGVSGEFTVPAGVTEVRFQLDFRNPRPLVIVDNCIFRVKK